MSPTKRSIDFPVSRLHARRRSLRGSMGVRVCAPSSWSHCRRTKLSTIPTVCPFAERYNAVAHPQYPSPPRTIIFTESPRVLGPSNTPPDHCSSLLPYKTKLSSLLQNSPLHQSA